MRATWLLALMLACAAAQADDAASVTDQASQLQFETDVRPLLEKYCVGCHSTDDPEAGLSLEFQDAPDLSAAFEEWTVVLQKLGGQEMPPEDADQPTETERAELVRWVNAGLAAFDCTQQTHQPRATVRRLNRFEYNLVIADLLHVNLTPADDFPADDVGEGFDNIGEVLSLPPLLMEKYLEAAEQVTNALLEDTAAFTKVFPHAEAEAVADDISHLAERAFRRPLTDAERKRLWELFRLAEKSTESRQQSLAFVTQAILVSPKFLFRVEEPPQPIGQELTPLDDFALASRLSFFLWSTIPDEELHELARQGKLKDPDTLADQVRRMLKAEKSQAFIDSFAGQWLELRLLESAAPDPDLFPGFDASLRAAMVEETSRYFRELVVFNGNILDLLDSNYTFVNQRLAKHYGIPDVEGDAFRKVSLQSDRRGGILSHASILTLTSNPTRTSPVKRGKWILENILGTPPPPPPPNVPELEEGEDLLGSLRERMQQHRENPSCAVCHRKMDALGFGFENFDAVGQWREQDGRYAIDASGELPGAKTFNTPAELRKILTGDSREFTSCLTRKLLTYALGRALSSRDLCLVSDIVNHVESKDHRFVELVIAIVTSESFRYTGALGEP